jgi:hypothetical protein
LGQLGQQQFGQGYDITRLQAGLGGDQQQQVQRLFDIDYQDFMNERLDPMRQASFYSDITRGIPLSQTYRQTTEPTPPLLSQVAGAGTALYGASRMMGGAAGGSVPGGLADLAISRMR